ncbi:MAG: hypothetical protein ACREFV_03085 [Acetobacteraceae bacterium]
MRSLCPREVRPFGPGGDACRLQRNLLPDKARRSAPKINSRAQTPALWTLLQRKKQKQENIADLTFGEYVLLLQQPTTWEKLDLRVDKAVLTKLMEDVRTIRNDVMHFDPDPMTSDELGTLKRAVRLMQEVGQPAPQVGTRFDLPAH